MDEIHGYINTQGNKGEREVVGLTALNKKEKNISEPARPWQPPACMYTEVWHLAGSNSLTTSLGAPIHCRPQELLAYWPETLNGITSSYHSKVIHRNMRFPHPYINSIPSSSPYVNSSYISLLTACLTKEKATVGQDFSVSSYPVYNRLDTWWKWNKYLLDE